MATEADARTSERDELVRAGRIGGASEATIARQLGISERQLRRFHGARRAFLAEHASALAAAAVPTEPERAPEPVPVPKPKPKPPVSRRLPGRAPEPEPRRPRRPWGWDDRWGQRVDEMSGDLPWSPERLRAATERKLKEVAKRRAEEYGVPQAIVFRDDGSASVISLPPDAFAADDPPARNVYATIHHRPGEDDE